MQHSKSLEDLMAEYGIQADEQGMPITANMQSLTEMPGSMGKMLNTQQQELSNLPQRA